MKPHTTHHDDCGCLSEKHRAEIDALRARADKLEGALVCANNNTKRGRLALAASQAEARELREALSDEWAEGTGTPKSCGHAFVCVCVGDKTTAALSRPPGDDTALREVCRKVAALAAVEGAEHATQATTGALPAGSMPDPAAIVNRILGQPGDDAAPTKEDQMPESREMTLTEKQVVDLAAVVFGKSVEKDPVIEDIFTYHAPEGDQAARYQLIREAAKQFAYTIHCLCEPGPDRTTAIRKVREATMTANQSIATKNAQYR